jgi:hypothetical protein
VAIIGMFYLTAYTSVQPTKNDRISFTVLATKQYLII